MKCPKTLARALATTGAAACLALAGCRVTATTARRPQPHPPGRAVGWHKHQPRLVLIPGTTIYYAADVQGDVFVHQGVWYRHQGGAWFTSPTWGGAWVAIAAPPVAFRRIPPGHAKHHVVRVPRPAHVKARGPKPRKRH